MSARRGFWPLRDLPGVLWLLSIPVVSLLHPLLPAPRWLMVHALLLGAVSHSVLVWSRHFALAVLHAADEPDRRRGQSARLVLLNGGALVVISGGLAGAWPVTATGATAVAAAVAWHGVSLARLLRAALPARFGTTVRYYVAAAALLPLGALLGVGMARGDVGVPHARLLTAHVVLNVLGWVGLTVVGTLVTLWPTMLRTRIAEGAERAARRALPVLVVALLGAAAAALLGSRVLAAVGLLGYLAGLLLVARPFADTARRRRPASYPTWSVLAGVAWLVGSVLVAAVGVGTADGWAEAESRLLGVTPFLAAGFGAQVLLGALSYLVPSITGGGPTPVRAGNAVMARAGAFRLVLVNGGLLVCALPLHGAVRVLASALALGGLAAFLPLLVLTTRATRRARQEGGTAPGGPVPLEPPTRVVPQVGERQPPHHVAAGLALLALAVALGTAVDAGPRTVGAAAQDSDVPATGETTTVQVAADDMRFSPSTVEVPAGDRLVVVVTNRDSDVHDLVLDTGHRTGRLDPGAGERLDVGVVTGDLEGWCSLLGHRQMGMVLHVRVTGEGRGAAAVSGSGAGHAGHHGDAAAAPLPPRDPVLPALSGSRVHRLTLTVREVDRVVAPGVMQRLWTFGGTAPGPVLHGRVGDVFDITLVNRGERGHSVDFHAGALAPDRPMRTIAPGQSLRYSFRATRAGVWMYHCSTMPMSAHIANGMHGAVVIEPSGLPAVDRSYLLVQSELYLGADGGPVDVAKLRAEQPDHVVFNGVANQYDAHPLAARVGERVRVWVLDAGPNRSTSFHVVGAQFDTTYLEGAFRLTPGEGGAQSLALAPAQGGFVELTFPQPGSYPFVSHVMVDAERGAHGLFRVTR